MVERVGVVGAGTMGAGIAQVAALGGFETFLHDPIGEALDRGVDRLRRDLARGAERARWSEDDARAAEGRLNPAPHVGDLSGCELVIEAAPEDLELKRTLFREAEDLCGPDAVLATNTSSLSVTAIAAGVEHRDRVIGMHFFNPPALMRLVEIVAGDESGERALAEATAAAERMGRIPIRAADGIGFVANRCVRPFSLEALKLVTEGVPHDQVDRIVRMGGGFRMGPFELMDLVGVDVNLEVAKSFWEQSFHEPRWRPSPLQTRLVDAGRLGRKSGRGWYRYDDGAHRPDDPEGPLTELPDDPLFDGEARRRRPRASTSNAFRSAPPAWSWAASSPSSSTRRTSRSGREWRARRTSTRRCASASTGPAVRSSGPRRSGNRRSWPSSTRSTPSSARSATAWRLPCGAPPPSSALRLALVTVLCPGCDFVSLCDYNPHRPA